MDELTTKCIRCGFCLEACPTFVITGEETESPRGRIYLARSAQAGKIDWEDARPHIDKCMGCRACESACPSGVEYGQILELARSKLEALKPSFKKRFLLWATTNPRVFRVLIGLIGPIRLISPIGPIRNLPIRQQGLDWPNQDASLLPPIRGKVYLLEGCAMRVLYPNVHEATRRLLRRIGFETIPISEPCCGALHAHNGFFDRGQTMANAVFDSVPSNAQIVVNSAGCGSHLKDQGDSRVVDVSELLVQNGLIEILARSDPISHSLNPRPRIAYHDACHLTHGQKIRSQPRELLNAIPDAVLVPLPDSDSCCGSAGVYSALQPKLARQALDRKWANIESTGCDIVAMGNPGCHAWIAQAARERRSRIRVMHTAEILEMALSGIL